MNKITEKYQIDDFNFILEHFRFILDLKDFIFGGNLNDILKTYEISVSKLKFITNQVFSEGSITNWYKRRFYKTKYLKEDILSIGEGVIKGHITKKSFMNLVNPQLQDLIQRHRREKGLEIGSSLFSRVGLEVGFTRWLFELPEKLLKTILKKYSDTLSKTELLVMCSKINKNLELLKFIVYVLINSSMSHHKISEITGKSLRFIKKYEKLIFCEHVVVIKKDSKMQIEDKGKKTQIET